MASADAVELAIVRSALAVLIQRAGGSIEYTESEFQGVRDWHGAYRIVGDIDRSGEGEPRIQLRIAPGRGLPWRRRTIANGVIDRNAVPTATSIVGPIAPGTEDTMSGWGSPIRWVR